MAQACKFGAFPAAMRRHFLPSSESPAASPRRGADVEGALVPVSGAGSRRPAIRGPSITGVAAVEVAASWGCEAIAEPSSAADERDSRAHPPRMKGGATAQRGGKTNSALLSCIDDALRSLDEAITAEDDEEEANPPLTAPRAASIGSR